MQLIEIYNAFAENPDILRLSFDRCVEVNFLEDYKTDPDAIFTIVFFRVGKYSDLRSQVLKGSSQDCERFEKQRNDIYTELELWASGKPLSPAGSS